jgi:hypothetical protein
VCVDDAGDRPRGGFGCGDYLWTYAVGEAVHHVLGDFVADVTDEGRHQQPGERIAPGQAERDSDQADKRSGR